MILRKDRTVRWNVELDDGRRFVVAFHPIDNCPGFSHRVRITTSNNTVAVAMDWLASESLASKQDTAAFFINKHIIIKP